MVDVARIEMLSPETPGKILNSAEELLCQWRHDKSPDGQEKYEEHFREYHWKPFMAEFHVSGERESLLPHKSDILNRDAHETVGRFLG
jgi:hypothetical protein